MNTTAKPEILPAEHYQDAEEEGRVVDNPDIGALVQLNSSEINQQILTARAYPRSLTQFRKNMREMVTLDANVAQACLYALKRGDKVIEGPSARFAEVAAQCWGNCRAGARVIDIGDEYITAQGAFYDLEKNMAVSYEVLRRITDKYGNRYNADMIGVTGNAACSIALRNAILKGVPKAFWGDAYEQARQVAFGKGEALANRRAAAIKAFAHYGVEPLQIYGLLGIRGAEDITIDHLVLLGGIYTAIHEGETTPEEAFATENLSHPDEVKPQSRGPSAFARNQPKQKDAAKGSSPKTSEPAATEKKPEPEPEPEPENEGTQEGEGASAEADIGASEYEDWYSDQVKALADITRIRDLADLRESVTENVDSDERLKAWNAACGKRQREIFDASRKPKK